MNELRLKQIKRQYDELQQRLQEPGSWQDPALFARLQRELQELSPVAEAYAEWEKTEHELSELEEMNAVRVYYAHPYCSCEKGTNENHNGLFRRFLLLIPAKILYRKIHPRQQLWPMLHALLSDAPRCIGQFSTLYHLFLHVNFPLSIFNFILCSV